MNENIEILILELIRDISDEIRSRRECHVNYSIEYLTSIKDKLIEMLKEL